MTMVEAAKIAKGFEPHIEALRKASFDQGYATAKMEVALDALRVTIMLMMGQGRK